MGKLIGVAGVVVGVLLGYGLPVLGQQRQCEKDAALVRFVPKTQVEGGAEFTPFTQTDLRAALLHHCVWLQDIKSAEKTVKEAVRESFRPQNRAYFFRVNLNEANLARAKLSGAVFFRSDLRGINLAGADLSHVLFQGTDLTGAIFTKADLRGADLSGRNLKGANFLGARLDDSILTGADLELAVLTQATLTNADLNDANLTGAALYFADLAQARLYRANLSEATFWFTDLSGAQFGGNNVLGTRFEPLPEDHPNFIGFGTAENLIGISYLVSPHGLAEIRKQFKNGSMTEEERTITYVMGRENRRRGWNSPWESGFANKAAVLGRKIEAALQFFLFELPVEYGRTPFRPLLILGFLVLLFMVPYSLALRSRTPAGIWKIWDRTNPFAGQQNQWEKQVLATRPRFFMYAVYFSILSAFHIGWRELNLGSWIARAMPWEFTLQPRGWVKFVTVAQSILSVYLIALSLLSYFGRPFE